MFYVAELINTLCYLQSKNIVHRDLKPGNMLFNDQWHLILADFGTAKVVKPLNHECQSPVKSQSGYSSFSSSTNTRNGSTNDIS
jgi:3-phosphoinositide dependent protein kinase-1